MLLIDVINFKLRLINFVYVFLRRPVEIFKSIFCTYKKLDFKFQAD